MPNIPSLKGLQALEAAARLGSFVAAARELSVSPAAVSQLVRSLEDQVGHKLFYRINRGITLTEAGLETLPRLSAAFEELRAVSRRISGSALRSRLTISAPPSVATGWLPLRIAEFTGLAGAVDISLREDNDPVDFERHRIDLRFSYGRFHYQTHATEEILTDSVIPVCSPEFLARYGPLDTARDIAAAPLIHTDWGPAAATFPVWRNWLENQEFAQESNDLRGIVANSSVMAVNFAMSGLGIALCQSLLASQHIASGHLVRVCEMTLAQSQPYCLTIPQRSTKRPVVSALRDWLIRTVTDDTIIPPMNPIDTAQGDSVPRNRAAR
ncbi:MAG: LysR family transcriptional regulator [Hyphomicrobiales bacterium]|nr:LysR family transcriptional regulator [Hyphomicrobiales bacterium]